MRFVGLELRPGVIVRLLEDGPELETCIEAVGLADLYPDPDERVRRWWHSPQCWPTVVTWRGQILQYDFFHLLDAGRVRAGLTLRPERDRTRWFWRECRKPILEQLLAAGFQTMESSIRADRSDWIHVMCESFAAEPIGPTVDGRWVRIRYDLARSLAACTGWPARRTAGPGWAWTRGPLSLREGDRDEARPAIEALWGDRPRKAVALAMLDAWWEVDAATLLLATDGAGPAGVRAVRWRGNEAASRLAILTPIDAGAQHDVAEGIRAWHRAVGYMRCTSFVPKAQWALAAIRRHAEGQGFRVVREHRDAYEVEVEV